MPKYNTRAKINNKAVDIRATETVLLEAARQALMSHQYVKALAPLNMLVERAQRRIKLDTSGADDMLALLEQLEKAMQGLPEAAPEPTLVNEAEVGPEKLLISWLHKLGRCQYRVEQYNRAKRNFCLALCLSLSIYGGRSQRTISIARSLGSVLRKLDENETAIRFLKPVLAWHEFLGDKDDVIAVQAMTSMAASLAALGRYDEALPHFEEAWKRSILIETIPFSSTARLTGCVADTLLKLERFEEAEKYCHQAHLDAVDCYGKLTLSTALASDRYVQCLIELGRFGDAKPLAEDYARLSVKHLGDKDKLTLQRRFALARVLIALKREGAQEVFNKTYKLAVKTLDKDHPLVVQMTAMREAL